MLLAPSILAGDLTNLAATVDLCETGGADLVHVDVMDGQFVPNLTFGIPVIRALAERTRLPLDVHLMVEAPERLLDDYLQAGASWLAVHWEAVVHHDRVLEQIRGGGARCGVALNPSTPVEMLVDLLPQLDYVLLMSVNPGFAGQRFLPYVVEKARRLRCLIDAESLDVTIAMDGGIETANVGEVAAAGVGLCVAGSSIFGAADPVAAMQSLKSSAIRVESC